MTTDERSKLLLSDTLVPDLFITQYMSSLNGSAIQLYLFLLLNRDSSRAKMNVEKLAKKIGWTQSETEEQVFILTAAGLLERDEEGTLSLADIKAREIDRYIESKANEGLLTPPQHMEPALMSLTRSIDDTFFMGKMNYAWHRFIDESASVYKLKPEVIYALFDTLHERKKLFVRSPRSAEELRSDWCNRGVHTAEDLEKVTEEDRRIKECVASLGKKTRKALDGIDLEYVHTWICTYKMNPDVPAYLYTLLRKDKEKVTFAQMDIVMQEWFSHNIHTVEEASTFEVVKRASDRTAALTNFCGSLFRKKLDGMDLTIIEKWANVDCWEEPIVSYAYEVLHNYMNTITLSNVDDRLNLWKANGIASVTKAKQFESELKRKNKEDYQMRKGTSGRSQADDIPYMENEYTKEHLDRKEQESNDYLDQLLSGDQ